MDFNFRKLVFILFLFLSFASTAQDYDSPAYRVADSLWGSNKMLFDQGLYSKVGTLDQMKAFVFSGLIGYELLSNKSTNTNLGTSNLFYPTQGAVKSYVDGKIAALSFYPSNNPNNYITLAQSRNGFSAPDAFLNYTPSTGALITNYTPENAGNKSTNINLGTSDVLYSTQRATKLYVDGRFGTLAPSAFSGLYGDLGNLPDLSLYETRSFKNSSLYLGTSSTTYPAELPVRHYIDSVAARISGSLVSPLNQKGDFYVYGTTNTRLPVGANGTFPVADNTQTLGIAYKTIAQVLGYTPIGLSNLSATGPNYLHYDGAGAFSVAYTPESAANKNVSNFLNNNFVSFPSNGTVKHYVDSIASAIISGNLASPLNQKGDLWIFGSFNTKLPLGANNTVPVVDNSTALGLTYKSISQVLGFTPETISNKNTTLYLGSGLSKYPAEGTVKHYVDSTAAAVAAIVPALSGTNPIGYNAGKIYIKGLQGIGGLGGYHLRIKSDTSGLEAIQPKVLDGTGSIHISQGAGGSPFISQNGNPFVSQNGNPFVANGASGYQIYQDYADPTHDGQISAAFYNYILGLSSVVNGIDSVEHDPFYVSDGVSRNSVYPNPSFVGTLDWSKIINPPAFLTSELDASVPSWVKSITNTEKTNWNTAYSWGNHGTQGYLKNITGLEIDPSVPSYVKSISSLQITHWDQAYSNQLPDGDLGDITKSAGTLAIDNNTIGTGEIIDGGVHGADLENFGSAGQGNLITFDIYGREQSRIMMPYLTRDSIGNIYSQTQINTLLANKPQWDTAYSRSIPTGDRGDIIKNGSSLTLEPVITAGNYNGGNFDAKGRLISPTLTAYITKATDKNIVDSVHLAGPLVKFYGGNLLNNGVPVLNNGNPVGNNVAPFIGMLAATYTQDGYQSAKDKISLDSLKLSESVLNVIGKENEITSTGGQNPVIGISENYRMPYSRIDGAPTYAPIAYSGLYEDIVDPPVLLTPNGSQYSIQTKNSSALAGFSDLLYNGTSLGLGVTSLNSSYKFQVKKDFTGGNKLAVFEGNSGPAGIGNGSLIYLKNNSTTNNKAEFIFDSPTSSIAQGTDIGGQARNEYFIYDNLYGRPLSILQGVNGRYGLGGFADNYMSNVSIPAQSAVQSRGNVTTQILRADTTQTADILKVQNYLGTDNFIIDKDGIPASPKLAHPTQRKFLMINAVSGQWDTVWTAGGSGGGGGSTTINLATNASGTAFGWSASSVSGGGTATFNIPLAASSVTNGGVSNTTQSIFGRKSFIDIATVPFLTNQYFYSRSDWAQKFTFQSDETNQKTALVVNAPTNAVNYFTLSPGATGVGPTIDATGTGSVLPINYNTKNGGEHIFNSRISGTGLRLGTKTMTSIGTLGADDHMVFANASGGAFTIFLPAAASCDGMEIIIKKTDSSSNAVTVTSTGSGSGETIDGSTNNVISTQYLSRHYVSNGANWFIQ